MNVQAPPALTHVRSRSNNPADGRHRGRCPLSVGGGGNQRRAASTLAPRSGRRPTRRHSPRQRPSPHAQARATESASSTAVCGAPPRRPRGNDSSCCPARSGRIRRLPVFDGRPRSQRAHTGRHVEGASEGRHRKRTAWVYMATATVPVVLARRVVACSVRQVEVFVPWVLGNDHSPAAHSAQARPRQSWSGGSHRGARARAWRPWRAALRRPRWRRRGTS